MDFLDKLAGLDAKLMADVIKHLGVKDVAELQQNIASTKQKLALVDKDEAVRKQLDKLIRNGAPLQVLKGIVDNAVRETGVTDVVARVSKFKENLAETRKTFSKKELMQGLNMTPFNELQGKMNGFRTGGKIYLVAGRAGCGKTTIMRNLALNLVRSNKGKVFICYISLDDSIYEMLPHFVSQLSGLPDDLVSNYYMASDPQKAKIDAAWKLILEDYADSFMLIDANTVATLTDVLALNDWLSTEKKGKHVVMFLDNFHDLQHPGELREKNSECINRLKESVVNNNNTLVASVQLIKLYEGRKPTREDMAETVQIDYKGNMVMLVHNEVDVRPEAPRLAVEIEDQTVPGGKTYAPVIELMATKNKIIPKCKGSFFFKFSETSSELIEIPRSQIKSYVVEHEAPARPSAYSGRPKSFPKRSSNLNAWSR